MNESCSRRLTDSFVSIYRHVSASLTSCSGVSLCCWSFCSTFTISLAMSFGLGAYMTTMSLHCCSRDLSWNYLLFSLSFRGMRQSLSIDLSLRAVRGGGIDLLIWSIGKLKLANFYYFVSPNSALCFSDLSNWGIIFCWGRLYFNWGIG